MFKPYTKKIIFVDEEFLVALKQKSITSYRDFESTEVDTQIITLPLSEANLDAVLEHVDSSFVRPGKVLVKPDYSDKFMPIERFSDDNAVQKYRLWLRLCMALGAKKVIVKDCMDTLVDSDEILSTSGNANVKIPKNRGAAGYTTGGSNSHEKAEKTIREIQAEAGGAAPNLALAGEILKKYALDSDDMFQHLYEMRSLSNNPVIVQEFCMDLSSDVKRVFDSSLKAKVELLGVLYGGSASYEKISKSIDKARTALKIYMRVEFPAG